MIVTIEIPLFWSWLFRLAYRRMAKGQSVKPVGIPGNRDPSAPCTAFDPRPWLQNDWNDCQTDGHYLCDECAHRAPRKTEEELS